MIRGLALKVIIAGGRDYKMSREDFDWLTNIFNELGGIDEVITGGAPGADHYAEVWAEYNFIKVTVFPAQWTYYGRAAGPIRNKEMLDYAGDNAILLLFPGGAGTADIKRQAEKRGVRIIEKPLPSISSRG